MRSTGAIVSLSLGAVFAATLAACGGSPSGTAPAPAPAPAPTPAPPPAPATTLSASVAQLAMKASGNPRTVTITNTGLNPALDLALDSTGLPVGTSVTTCGATLAASASCVLTFTPGATPTAAPGNAAPSAALLEVAGSNTNTLNLSVSVLAYGSVHQGGYVFAFDDSTAATGSIGGTVAALSDSSLGVVWGGVGTVTNAQSLTDGASNTAAIVGALGGGAYAAQVCADASMGGHSDWYLPAICELGYDAAGGACGTQATPVLADNMQSRLKDASIPGAPDASWRWSSSENAGLPSSIAHSHLFDPMAPAQAAAPKVGLYRVRCARALTP